jgi:hypothetical protein
LAVATLAGLLIVIAVAAGALRWSCSRAEYIFILALHALKHCEIILKEARTASMCLGGMVHVISLMIITRECDRYAMTVSCYGTPRATQRRMCNN